MGSDRVCVLLRLGLLGGPAEQSAQHAFPGPGVDSSSGSMSRPVICDLPSTCCGGVNPLTRWVTTLKCEEPHCLADLNGWVAIAWQAAETCRWWPGRWL